MQSIQRKCSSDCSTRDIYLAITIKAEKRLCAGLPKVKIQETEDLPKPPEAHFGSFDSIKVRHFVEKVSPNRLPFFGHPGWLVITFESDSRYHRRAREPTITETILELKKADYA